MVNIHQMYHQRLLASVDIKICNTFHPRTHTHISVARPISHIYIYILSMAHDQWIRLQEHGELGTLLTVEGPLWGRVTGRRRRWDWLQEEF